MEHRLQGATILFLGLSLAPANAATLRVPDDFPTIQAGISAAAEGDTVLVAPGTYTGPGNRALNFMGTDLVLISEGGADVTTIDCERVNQAIGFTHGETPAAVVRGFTMRRGSAHHGGAIRCYESSPTIDECVFLDNEAMYDGGAIACEWYSSPTISNCVFSGNRATEDYAGGGALYLSRNSSLITGCRFVNNNAGGGAAVTAVSCSAEFVDCMFADNGSAPLAWTLRIDATSDMTFSQCTFTGNDHGALLAIDAAGISISGCTFSENYGMAIGLMGDFLTTIDHTIVAFTVDGPGVECYGGGIAVSCCDVYGNDGGDWVACLAGLNGIDGNSCADPLFCGAAEPEAPFSLDASSPCAPGSNPECGLIGAWDVGCGFTAAERSSWGVIKGMFR